MKHLYDRSAINLAVELALLVVAAPLLYFPGRFPAWVSYVGLCMLALGWVWRRIRLGIWWERTPADWALVLLFCIMLPISVWAAPGPLRQEYSIPRTLIMLWNITLFAAVVAHGKQSSQAARLALAGFLCSGTLIALVAPFGTHWQYKLPLVKNVVDVIPGPLRGVFAGAEEGFHPNQVAGTLLYVFPLALTLMVSDLYSWRRGEVAVQRSIGEKLAVVATAAGTVVMGVTLLLSQSRTALIGLVISIMVMGMLNWRLGRRMLLFGFCAFVIWLPFFPASLLESLDEPPGVVEGVVGYTDTFAFRPQVWRQAVTAIHDFPFTGMGFGTFREIVWLFYPIEIGSTTDFGHAHNLFLQFGLDFGLPGMIALIAIYLVVLASLWFSLKTRWSVEHKAGLPLPRPDASFAVTIGLAGCTVAHSVYSQFDAVTAGAKTNFTMWFLFALVIVQTHLVRPGESIPHHNDSPS